MTNVKVGVFLPMALLATHTGTTFHVGDTVRVDYKLIEKEIVSGKTKKEKHEEQKERIQGFSGIVIAIRGKDENQSFVVRHIGSGNIGVERIFPLVSPWIKKVAVTKRGTVRRAKLYYLREKTSREIARIKENTSVKVDSGEDKPVPVKNNRKRETPTAKSQTQPAEG